MKILFLLFGILFCSKMFCTNQIVVGIDTFHFEYPQEIINLFDYNKIDSLSNDCNNEEALRVFNQFINILRNYRNGENSIDYMLMIRCILTNLFILLRDSPLPLLEDRPLSETEGSFLDYTNMYEDIIMIFEEWFQMNKETLCWYKEKNILYQKKE